MSLASAIGVLRYRILANFVRLMQYLAATARPWCPSRNIPILSNMSRNENVHPDYLSLNWISFFQTCGSRLSLSLMTCNCWYTSYALFVLVLYTNSALTVLLCTHLLLTVVGHARLCISSATIMLFGRFIFLSAKFRKRVEPKRVFRPVPLQFISRQIPILFCLDVRVFLRTLYLLRRSWPVLLLLILPGSSLSSYSNEQRDLVCYHVFVDRIIASLFHCPSIKTFGVLLV